MNKWFIFIGAILLAMSLAMVMGSAACDYTLNACKTSGWVADSTYCLTDNLTADVCMEVDANNVTIDGQGHWINGPTSGFGTYTGVKFYGFDDCSIYNTTINGYKTFGGAGLRLANTDRTTVSSVYLNNSYLALSVSGQTTTNMTLVNVQMEDSRIAATLGTHTGNRFIWNNSYGEIKFTEEITDSINSDIVFGVGGSVELSTNYAYLDSNIDELSNLAANITLYNTGITTAPTILKDGVECTDCTLLSSDGDNHTFNVTSWSNYTISSSCDYELSACKTSGWVADSTYCLANNLTHTGLASACLGFSIDVSNVTIDGNGFSILGDDTFGSYGINDAAANIHDNITIKNFLEIRDFSNGIGVLNDQDWIIENVTLVSNNRGIYINGVADDIILRNLTFSGNGEGVGISAASTNINISGNVFTSQIENAIQPAAAVGIIIDDNTFTNNQNDVKSIIPGNGGVVTDNTFTGTTGASLDLKNGDNWYVNNNTVSTGAFSFLDMDNLTITNNAITIDTNSKIRGDGVNITGNTLTLGAYTLSLPSDNLTLDNNAITVDIDDYVAIAPDATNTQLNNIDVISNNISHFYIGGTTGNRNTNVNVTGNNFNGGGGYTFSIYETDTTYISQNNFTGTGASLEPDLYNLHLTTIDNMTMSDDNYILGDKIVYYREDVSDVVYTPTEMPNAGIFRIQDSNNVTFNNFVSDSGVGWLYFWSVNNTAITIDNLSLTINPTISSWGSGFMGKDTTIQNSYINLSISGVDALKFEDDCNLLNSEIDIYSGGNGIVYYGSNIYVYNNTISTFNGENWGIYDGSSASDKTNVTILNNTMNSNGGSSRPIVFYGDGYTNVWIEGNDIHASGNDAISFYRDVSDVVNVTLKNNNITTLNNDSISYASGATCTNCSIIYDNEYGTITWDSIPDVTDDMTFTGIINLSSNYAYLNSTALPDLNISADITLNNTGKVINLEIWKDGEECTDCTLLSSSGDNHTFNVTSWSNYTIYSDIFAPVITINSIQNDTQGATPPVTLVEFNVTLNEPATCTLNMNGTAYVNATLLTSFEWNLPLDDGNYTAINFTCEDVYSNSRTSNTYWVSVDTGRAGITVDQVTDDTSSPWWTNDTTPTILLTTSENADCRASTTDESYDDMGDNVDCIGDGTTSHSCTMGALAEGERSVYFACNDSYGNKDSASTNTLATINIDTTLPIITWTWANLNTTTSSDTQDITWTTDELATCTLNFNGTTYINNTLTTSHSVSLYSTTDGNYTTINATCNDKANNANTSSNIWWNVDNQVNFASPTQANNTNTTGLRYYYVNVTTNFDIADCLLEWEGSNFTMQTETNYAYLNKSADVQDNYTYQVFCNATYGSYYTASETRVIEILEPIPPDEEPPVITSISPISGTTYSSSFGGVERLIRVTTDEQVSDCRYSRSTPRSWSLMSNFFSENGMDPAYRHTFLINLPSPGITDSWYILCEDTLGNRMTTPRKITYSVSTGRSSGGGGAPPDPIIIQGDIFDLWRRGGAITCTGTTDCRNSKTYSTTEGKYIPIPLETRGGEAVAPTDGKYTVCNLKNNETTLFLSIVGYTTNWGDTSTFLSLDKENLTLDGEGCGTFQITANYPSGATSIFQNGNLTPYYVQISGELYSIQIPVKALAPPKGVSESIEELTLFGLPVILWFILIFLGVLIIIIIGRRTKRK